MSNKKEIRSLPLKVECEYRDVDKDNKQPFVCGIGVVYNEEVEIWEGYFETINIGAFTETLTNGDEVHCYFNHNPDYVLSKTTNEPPNNLVLEDKEEGLLFGSPIPDTSYGRDLKINLTNGNIKGASFSFTVPEGGSIWTRDGDGNTHRTITKAILYEVGPVTNPAYPMTTAETNCRSKDDLMAEADQVFAKNDIPDVTINLDEELADNKNYLETKKLKLKLFERNL